MSIKQFKNFEGIFSVGSKIATKNLTPGTKVYGEELIKEEKTEYRIWDIFRSKPAAAIKKGIKNFPIKKGGKVLYLGIASGTTASHFSDIIGEEGIIYGIEVAERVLKDIIRVAEKRGNIVPILSDARIPEKYANNILEKVDVVYCDVADPEEVELFIRNCKMFLKENGYGMIAIKSQSIDVTKDPKVIYEESKKKLEKEGFKILDFVKLDPYDKAHGFFVVQIK